MHGRISRKKMNKEKSVFISEAQNRAKKKFSFEKEEGEEERRG